MLENPLLKSIIRFSGNHQFKDGKSYLETALDDVAGNEGHYHSLARMVFSGIIGLAVNLGCAAFNLDLEEARNAIKVPYFKKGLLNILSGIGNYGVTKPQRIPAPFLAVWNYTNACNLRCKHCYQRADKRLQTS